ncbi:ankyrin repeat domain-containing protein [Cardinium endosymbiont of Culicoides punctatus]|uniref:ankyrin repeat domain-containing protein n=1 Tax=Cardinium endosymbiont of Culicoides punctatus TaxID=2304601 RepID=UPI0010586748|nr:ankyrin repeat domain-containing protein [Cardinium endosymbiont of Culicoides punctatus]TDG94983.1 hypothetical protein CCPUN_06390 [Cardinium endosymbiont of Culicoides punctatus]
MKYIYKIIAFLAMVWVTTGISKCKSVAHGVKHNRTSNDNTKLAFSISALKEAIRKGNLKEVEKEVSKSSDPKKDLNKKIIHLPPFSQRGIARPLYIAMYYRHKEKNPEKKEQYLKIIELLLKKGANPCLFASSDILSTSYHITMAAGQQDAPVVQLLLDYGANVNQLDSKDGGYVTYDGAIHKAMKNGDIATLKILLKDPNIDVNLHAYILPLHAGIYGYRDALHKGNQIEAVKLLLQNDDIKINEEDNNQYTALDKAVVLNCTEIVELLLKQKGIDIEHKNCHGRTPLAQAVHNGNVEIVKLLLKHGANPKAISIKNALLSKLGFGKHKEIKKLLKEAKKNQKKTKESLPVFDAIHVTEKDGACSICLSKLVDTSEHQHAIKLKKCNHKFHLDCISEWVLINKTCPYCRTNME